MKFYEITRKGVRFLLSLNCETKTYGVLLNHIYRMGVFTFFVKRQNRTLTWDLDNWTSRIVPERLHLGSNQRKSNRSSFVPECPSPNAPSTLLSRNATLCNVGFHDFSIGFVVMLSCLLNLSH